MSLRARRRVLLIFFVRRKTFSRFQLEGWQETSAQLTATFEEMKVAADGEKLRPPFQPQHSPPQSGPLVYLDTFTMVPRCICQN
jgi:hypothetical protein